jgi:hypothetical protein
VQHSQIRQIDRHHCPALISHDQNRAGDEECEMKLVVFAAAGISVDAFHNALSAKTALENGGSIGRIVLKAVGRQRVHQRVTYLSESTRARICR